MGPNGCVGGFVHGGHPGTIVFSWEPGYVNFKWNWADGRAEVKHPSLKESESVSIEPGGVKPGFVHIFK